MRVGMRVRTGQDRTFRQTCRWDLIVKHGILVALLSRHTAVRVHAAHGWVEKQKIRVDGGLFPGNTTGRVVIQKILRAHIVVVGVVVTLFSHRQRGDAVLLLRSKSTRMKGGALAPVAVTSACAAVAVTLRRRVVELLNFAGGPLDF